MICFMLFLSSFFLNNKALNVTSQYALRLMRGSGGFDEVTWKSAGQWNQLIHYPIPVVWEKQNDNREPV
jgi:hypothetical protein